MSAKKPKAPKRPRQSKVAPLDEAQTAALYKKHVAFAHEFYDRMAAELKKQHPAKVDAPCSLVYNGLAMFACLVSAGFSPDYAVQLAAVQILDHISSKHVGAPSKGGEAVH